jgi:aspartate/methionine/tyrosine aminotransferase
MEVGQPSTKAPTHVLNTARSSLNDNMIGYTNALGITPLKKAIADLYRRKYNTLVSPEQIVVTTGSSAAFLFVFLGGTKNFFFQY